jgi:hypothetical protein
VKLQKLHRALLTLDDGQTVEVERIGKGRYTTAWANGSHVYLQTDERDASKEMLAHLAVEPRNPHIPDCRYVGMLERHKVYTMPKYRKVTARDTREAYAQLRRLIAMRDKAYTLAIKARGCKFDGYDINNEFRELLENGEGASLPETLRDALTQLLDEAENYGEYTVEFRRANVAADEAGTLILLDPLFDLAEVRTDSQQRAKAARGY